MKTELLSKRATKRRTKFAAAIRSRRAAANDFTAFEAQTFLHINTLCCEALCLTGNREDAADLVVAAYARAFRDYDQFRRQSASYPRRASTVLDCLYRSLHAAFCDGILVKSGHH